MRRWRRGVGVLGVGIAVVFGGTAWAAVGTGPDSTGREEVPVGRWLVAGPVAETLPLFETEDPAEVSARLLDEPAVPLEDLWPEAGESLAWSVERDISWRERSATGGTVFLDHEPQDTSIALLACYLESSRWQEADLVVRSRNVLCIYLDGKEVARRATAAPSTEEEPETQAALEIPTGKCRLLIRTALSPGDGLDEWSLGIFLRIPTARAEDVPAVSLSPERTFARLDDLSRAVAGGEVRISPDGARFVVERSRWIAHADRTERFFEVRRTEDGALLHTLDLRASVSSPAWSPDGSRLAVVVAGEDEASDLWVLDLGTGAFERVLEGKKSLSNIVWSGTGEEILYLVDFEVQEDEEKKYERLTEPYMRWPKWKVLSHLRIVSLADGVDRPLAQGEFSVGQLTVCPTRPLAAFVRTVPIDVRPYEKMELWTLDLETLEAKRERDLRFAVAGDLTLGPWGRRIAWVASPSESDTSAASVDHNAYEQDLYVWDRAAATTRKLTDGFDPSVGADLYGAGGYGARIWWNPEDGWIYFTATDGGLNRLYRVDPDAGVIDPLPLEPTAVFGISGSGPGRTLLLYGSSIDRPPRLFRYDLKRERLREVLFPGEPVYRHIRFSAAEPWSFVNSRGQEIEGWIYVPPDFDRTRAYPLIVYYYGGVFPNGEAFVWRHHYLAANGYVVYTLNPVGCAGYGPQFADLHVNDWGDRTADDVIEGVRNLLAEKKFIDGDRVGAFGGSYGGFLTMLILTRTELFAAAEASYGISNITSYWGEGRWGYLYGDVAMARSYPWNRPDIFVERSPLFRADKIRTPLLLTHGTGDTNVPSGESDQMFTALRVLRRDVVYVRFAGEEHGIQGTQAVRAEHNAIRLEWFDKHLKDQPEAWENRWKE